MSEITVFECDVTGERFGAKNDVIEIGVRRRWSNNPFAIHNYTVHVSLDAAEDHDVRAGALQHINWVGVENGTILGACTGDTEEYRERDDVVIDYNEPTFKFLEDEVIR